MLYHFQGLSFLHCLAVAGAMLPSILFAQSRELSPKQAEELRRGRTSVHQDLRSGDKAFRENRYEEAELDYRRALEAGDQEKAAYNLGLSLAKQKRFAEARESFEQAAASDQIPSRKADAHFNAGMAALMENNPSEAVKSLVEGLKIQPQDEEMRQQLAQALRQLKQQQQQQQGESEQKKEQEEDEQKPGESDPQEQASDQPSSPEPPDPNASENKGQSPAQNPEDLTPQEARRLLEIAKEQERRTQERMRLGEPQSNRPLKDW